MDRMAKALVVSDTHGNRSSLNQIAREYADVEYLFHLGDYAMDAEYLADELPHAKVISVKGNCDLIADAPEFEEIVIGGNKIILTHGHTLNVKYSYDRVFFYAQEHEAKAILFGHTHVPCKEYKAGIWLVNPGSAGEETAGRCSVAMLLAGSAGIVPKILYL